jgi:hypothetical protein
VICQCSTPAVEQSSFSDISCLLLDAAAKDIVDTGSAFPYNGIVSSTLEVQYSVLWDELLVGLFALPLFHCPFASSKKTVFVPNNVVAWIKVGVPS